MSKIIALGRYGDIVNALPLARKLADGGKVDFVVSPTFAPILKAASYVNPIECEELYSSLPIVMAKHPDAAVCQIYKHPEHLTEHKTDSYQKEAWRVAGHLEKFGTLPLVFDRRDYPSELDLLIQVAPQPQPYILVALSGVSSPFARREQLKFEIKKRFEGDFRIMDAADIKAANITDLIAVIQGARCLVTIDSLYLHLARATATPTVCLIQNGWFGSVPPPVSTLAIRYADAQQDLSQILDAVSYAVKPKVGTVHHVVDNWGDTERHARARQSWMAAYERHVQPCHITRYARSAMQIRDKRNLPYFKDVMKAALAKCSRNDIIVWTNSDNGVTAGLGDWAKENVGVFGACSMRRGVGHVGRDLFAFRSLWLQQNWNEIPDYILGASDFDLGLAALIRYKRGIVTTKDNLAIDFLPCDSPNRVITHEDHPSAWMVDPHAPANQFNRHQFMAWAKKYAPEIKFNREGQLL